eukprot:1139381-Pelagomonas_calceolata.AAC.5
MHAPHRADADDVPLLLPDSPTPPAAGQGRIGSSNAAEAVETCSHASTLGGSNVGAGFGHEEVENRKSSDKMPKGQRSADAWHVEAGNVDALAVSMPWVPVLGCRCMWAQKVMRAFKQKCKLEFDQCALD